MTARVADASLPCRGCGRTGMRWRRRELCTVCLRQAEENGTLIDFPPLRRASADVAEDYQELVRRDPHMPNAEIAARLGMKTKTLTKALQRARAAGVLTVRRVGVAHLPDIARHGETNGAPA